MAAGSTYRFKLLFIVLIASIFAVFLQNLCIKLGTVSGLNLAEACRRFLPMWLNVGLWLMAEAAVSFPSSLFLVFSFYLGLWMDAEDGGMVLIIGARLWLRILRKSLASRLG